MRKCKKGEGPGSFIFIRKGAGGGYAETGYRIPLRQIRRRRPSFCIVCADIDNKWKKTYENKVN